jgi:Ca2+-binding EF-hand superfamily protein
MGKQLDVSVVARIQRFAQNNRFKRGVLRLIAEELLSRPGAMAAESALAAESSFRGGITASPSCGNPIIQDPNSKQMQDIYRKLELTGEFIDRDTAAVALAKMGYKLEPSEIGRLLEQVDVSNSGKVRRAALAASQIDWRYLQQNRMSDWLHIAQRAFASLDKDSDGVLDVNDIITSLKAKLPPDELRLTVQQAMQEAGVEKDSDHMDFEGFLRMLKVGSVDSLDQYDARWDRPGASPSVGSIDRLQSLLDVSQHGSDAGSTRGRGLYAGVNSAVPAGAVASSAVSVYPSDQFKDYKDKSWNKPMVNFKFDFGNEFLGHKVNKADGGHTGPPKTRGAPEPAPELAVPRPSVATVSSALTASNSVFPATATGSGGESRVRGGTHFDKRMHGASLYRNAMLAPAGATAAARPLALPTVRE